VTTSSDRDHRKIQLVLRGGLVISAALMIAGCIATFSSGAPESAGDVKLFDLLRPHDLATTLLVWGVFTLALTPLVRVLALIVLWCHERDWRFVAVSTAVVVTLAAAAFAGKG
jgi:uncharacterized membrane protein